MKIAYVAGPYRSKKGVRQVIIHIRNAEEVALELWQIGYAVVCPHKNSELFESVIDEDVIMEGEVVIMKRCDLVVLMEGWENSVGSCNERKIAIEHRIPVFYWPCDARKLINFNSDGYDTRLHLERQSLIKPQ